MKKITKKFIVSIIVISLIIQPILCSILQIGMSQADPLRYTTTTSESAIVNKINVNTEYAVKLRTLVDYEMEYHLTFDFPSIAGTAAGRFKDGAAAMVTRSDTGESVALTMYNVFIGESKDGNKRHKHVHGRAKGTIWVKDVDSTSSEPNVTLHYSFIDVNASLSTDASLYKTTRHENIYWAVYSKDSLPKNNNTTEKTTDTKTANYIQNIIDKFDDIKSKVPYTGPTWVVPSYTGTNNGGSNTIQEKKINISDDSKRLYIRALYRRVLKREPSNEEIDGWLSKSVQQLSKGIILSTESNDKNSINSLSNEEYTKALYKYILGRDPDPDGLNNNVKALNNGLDKGSLIVSIINSDEFFNKRNKTVSTITLNEKLCNATYLELLKNSYEVIKPTSTTIKMYSDDIGTVKLLNISGNGVTDISGLSIFSNMESLVSNNNKVSNLSELSNMKGLKKLYLDNNALSTENIGVICEQKGLEELHLENNNLKRADIKGNLSKLTNLKKLYLSNNKIDDLSELETLTGLKELYVENNKVANVGAIDKLNLEKVSLKNNVLGFSGMSLTVNLSGIFNMARVSSSKLYTPEEFECTGCSFENGRMVVPLTTRYATIKIKGGIADGTTFTYQNNLMKLQFNDKTLADRLVRQLGASVGGREEANGKYIINISAIDVDKVCNLDLSATSNDRNEITDITGLEAFTNLKSLNLSNNKVKNLNKLSELKNLQTLTVRYNDLTSLDALQDVTSLMQLDASNNAIVDINGISNLNNLQTLILSNNNIQNNLKPISNLDSLSTLAISNNNVSNLSQIGKKELNSLYVSYNRISSLSDVSADKIEMKNNIIQIRIAGHEAELPDILKREIGIKGGVADLEFTNCELQGVKLIMQEDARVAQVKITRGDSSDSIVEIISVGDNTPPNVEVEYELVNNNTEMEVTLTADETIRNVLGWQKVGSNKIYRRYNYNISEQRIIVSDIYGNETEVNLSFSGVKNSKVPDFTVHYSSTVPTQDNVTVTVTSSEDLYVGYQGWSYVGDDTKAIQKTYTQNTTGTYRNENILTQRMFNIQMQPLIFDVSISNIDRQAPECTVEYNTKQTTKGAVRATIWANEEISVDNRGYIAVTDIDDNGDTIYGVMLYYTKNAQETVTVRDLAGNTQDVAISVQNIDNGVDGLVVNTSGVSATYEDITLNIHADESVTVNTGLNNQVVASAKQNEIVKADVAKSNLIKYSYRVASTSNKLPIATKEINIANAYSNIDTNSLRVITRVADAGDTIANENELSYNISEADYGIVEANDEANNTDVAAYDATYVDKANPKIGVELEEHNEDGTITITLAADEELRNSGNFDGWTLDGNGTRLTKTFKNNANESIEIYDLAGNKTEYNLAVTGVMAVPYTITADLIDGTEQYLVVIESDRELKEIEGWELSTDKKSLIKSMYSGEVNQVTIEDLNGNTSTVNILLTDDEDEIIDIIPIDDQSGDTTKDQNETKDNNQNKDSKQDEKKDNDNKNNNDNKKDSDNKNDNDNKKDNDSKKDDNSKQGNDSKKDNTKTNEYKIEEDKSKSPINLPQTGKSVATLMVISIVGGVAVITYTKYRKNKDIK